VTAGLPASIESARRRSEGVELTPLDAKLDVIVVRLDALEAAVRRGGRAPDH
jgi:hypothetical protein